MTNLNSNIESDLLNLKVDIDYSLKDLSGRCKECSKRIKEIYQ